MEEFLLHVFYEAIEKDTEGENKDRYDENSLIILKFAKQMPMNVVGLANGSM